MHQLVPKTLARILGLLKMSTYMYMVSTVLFEVTFRTHICSLFSAKVVIAFVCILVDKQLIVGGCDQYTYIALSHSVSESTTPVNVCQFIRYFKN